MTLISDPTSIRELYQMTDLRNAVHLSKWLLTGPTETAIEDIRKKHLLTPEVDVNQFLVSRKATHQR